ncbi:NAD(+) synthase [Mycoplasmopsis hyopharyngis]|uniref:NAD(+) synthase n=1 Tax=Mycoplasmopsis hyopharyngis TaxID=29558 RepID=UPI0038736857
MKRIGLEELLVKDKNIIEKYVDYLASWIAQKVKDAKCYGVVYGISGGIDSAVVSLICKRAFEKDSLGIIMPIDSMAHEQKDIQALIKEHQLNTKTVELNQVFSTLEKNLNLKNKLALSNIKPRLRMTTLYALAQELNYLVVGTDNEDEHHIGYFTKYGDGGVDILPIVNLLKKEVRMIAKYLNVPESIINKKPSAGLWEGQSDEDELGFTYNDLDNFLCMDYDKINTNIKAKIEKMHLNSEHKRNTPTKPMTIEQFYSSKQN